ncbi:apolipophorins-like protein, partial [Dinothrombium tinctorium]
SRALEQFPLLFSYDDGRVNSVCPSPDDEQWAVNVKKAIVSNLQVSMKNLHDSETTQETDILGDCETNYEVTSNSWQGIFIKKQKNARSCAQRQIATIALFPRSYSAPESSYRNFPVFASDYVCNYNIQSGIIRSSSCVEQSSLLPLAASSAASPVETKTKITFQQEFQSIRVYAPSTSYRQNLLYAANPEAENQDPQQMANILRNLVPSVSNGVQDSAPELFQQLVTAIQKSEQSPEKLAHLYESVQRKEFSQSEKLFDLFKDALCMAASESSIKVCVEKVLNDKNLSQMKLMYYSMYFATANQPTKGAVKSACQMLESQELPRQTVLGLSSLIHNYCNDNEEECKHNEYIKRAQQALARGLPNKCRQNDPQQVTEAVSYMKAIRNMGYSGEATRALFQCAASSNNIECRIAAIEALENDACDSYVQQKLAEIRQNAHENEEVRIAAYKAEMSCQNVTYEQLNNILQMIKQESSKQVGSYIESDIESKLQSSNPMEAELREQLQRLKHSENFFPRDIRKYSSRLVYSKYLERFGLGYEAEVDVIHQKDYHYRAMRAKFSLQGFERDVEVIEIGLRHDELHQKIASFIASQQQSRSVSEMINQALKHAKEILSGRNNVDGSLFVRIDGKDVFYCNLNDLKEISQSESNEIVNSWKTYLKNLANSENAMAITPVDVKFETLTSSGIPLMAQLKSTIVAANNFKNENLKLSFAAESKAVFKYGPKTSQRGYELKVKAHSRPSLLLKVENKSGASIARISIPDDETNLWSISSNVKLLYGDNQERPLQKSSSRQLRGCTSSFNKALGLEVCTKMNIPSKFLELSNYMNLDFQLALKKTDLPQAYEFALAYPSRNNPERMEYRVSFNTPGSRVNRDCLARAGLFSQNDGEKGINIELKTPNQAIEADAKFKAQSDELSASTSIKINQKKYALQAEIKKQKLGNNKYQWKQQFVVVRASKVCFNLNGVANLDTSRKTQFSFELNSNGKQLIKTQLVKDGSVFSNSNARVMGQFNANIDGNSAQAFVSLGKKSNASNLDLNLAWKMANQPKREQIKLSAKMSDSGTTSVIKKHLILELKNIQHPEMNRHLSWDILKTSERFEQELVYIRKNDFKNPKSKTRLLQVCQHRRHGKSISSELTMILFDGPSNRDYEFHGKSHIESGQSPKIILEVNGKEKNQMKNFKISLESVCVSKEPLRFSFNAQLLADPFVFKCSNEVEERKKNNYHGRVSVQLNNKLSSVDYNYVKKSEANGKSHQLDFEFKTSSMYYPTHHQALLRMSPYDIEIRSKLNHGGSQMWNYHTLLSKRGKSQMFLDSPIFTAKAESNPYQQNSLSNVQFIGKSIPVKHQTDVRLHSDGVTLNTKTIYKSKQMALNSHISRSASRIAVETNPLIAKFDYNTRASPMSANLEIQSKHTPASHKTSVNVGQGQVEIRSKTQGNGNIYANIDGLLSQNAISHFNVDTNRFSSSSEAQLYSPQRVKVEIRGKQLPYRHQSEVNVEPQSLRIASQTQHGSDSIFNLNSYLTQNGQSNANIETRNWVANIEAEPFASTKTAVIKVQHRPSQYQHETSVEATPQAWILSSTTQKSGQPIVSIDGQLSKVSHLKVSANQGNANVEVHQQGGKLVVSSPSFSHQSLVNKQPQAITLTSETTNRGQKLYSLSSQIGSNSRSYVQFNTQPYTANFEVNPQSANPNARLQINAVPSAITHVTDVSVTPSKQITISSKTQRQGQQIASLNSVFSKVGASQISLSTKPYDSSFEIQPFGSMKSAKFSVTGNQSPMSHVTEVAYQPNRQTTITSKTEVNNQNVNSIDGKLSQNDRSHLKFSTKALDAYLAVNPQSRNKQVEFQFNKHGRNTLYHSTKVSHQPGHQTTVYSKTDHNGKQIVLVDSKINYKSPSQVQIQTYPFDASLEIDPSSSVPNANFELKGRSQPYYHSTSFTYNPKRSLTINSRTEKSGQSLLALDSTVSTVGPSSLSVKRHQYQASVTADPFSNQKSVKIEYSNQRSGLVHNSEATYGQSQATFNSITKKRGANIATIRSSLSTYHPSTYGVSSFSSKRMNVNPLRSLKSASIEIDVPHIPLSHSTNINCDPQTFVIKSNTQSGHQKMFNLDSQFSNQHSSVVKVGGKSFDSSIEVNPFGNQKYGKVNYIGQNVNVEHNTELHLNYPQYNLRSKTYVNNQNLIDINSDVNRRGPSKIEINTPSLSGAVDINLQGNQKYGKLVVNGRQIDLEHNSEFNTNPRQTLIKTQTTVNRQNAFDLEAKLNSKGPSNIDIVTPYFSGNANIDPYKNQGSVNLNTQKLQHESEITVDRNRYALKSTTKVNDRRILCAVSVNSSPKSWIEAEISWDADRNPQNKINVALNAKKSQSNSLISVDILCKNHKGKVNFEVNDNILRGPHNINGEYRFGSDLYTFSFQHAARYGKMNCNLKANKNGHQVLSIENFAQYIADSSQVKMEARATVSSTSQSINGIEIRALFNKRKDYNGVRINSEFSAKVPGPNHLALHVTIAQKGLELNANARMDTSIYDLRQQEVALYSGLHKSKGEINGRVTTSSGKNVAIKAAYQSDPGEAEASFKCDSDFSYIPNVNAAANVKNRQQKSAMLLANVNQEKLLELNANFDFKNYKDFKGEASFDSKVTPHLLVSTHGVRNSQNTDYELDVKKDAENVLTAVFKGQNNRNGAKYNGVVDVAGSNLVFGQQSTQSEESYEAQYNGPLRPMTLNYRISNLKSEQKHSLKVCSPKCVLIEAIAQEKGNRYQKEKYSSISYQDQANNDNFRIEHNSIESHEKKESKLTANLNGDLYGYLLQWTERNYEASMYTPKQKIMLRARREKSGDISRTVVELSPEAIANPGNKYILVVSASQVITRSSIQTNLEYKLSHSSWNQPMIAVVNYLIQQNSPYFRILLKLNSGKGLRKQINFEVRYENPNNNPNNSSFSVMAYNGDRQELDITVSASMASQNNDHSLALNWSFLTKHKRLETGSHSMKINLVKKSISILSNCPRHQFEVEGNWKTSENRINFEGRVKADGEARNVHLQLDSSDNNLCAEAKLSQDPANSIYKVHACINPTNPMSLSFDSWKDNQRSTDCSISLNKTGKKAVKLHCHWNPSIMQKFSYYLEEAAKQVESNFELVEKVASEASHRLNWIKRTVGQEYVDPLLFRASSELKKLERSLGAELRPIYHFVDICSNYLSEVEDFLEPIIETLEKSYLKLAYAFEKFAGKLERELLRAATKACARNKNCYNLVYAYERQGWSGLEREFFRFAQNYQRDAHTFAVKVRGEVENLIDSLPNGLEQAYKWIVNRFSESDLASCAADYFNSASQAVLNAVNRIAQPLENVLMSNNDFKAAVPFIKEIYLDAKKELQSDKTEKIVEMLKQIVEFCFSPRNLLNSRMVTWNPKAGEMTFVVEQPASVDNLKKMLSSKSK